MCLAMTVDCKHSCSHSIIVSPSFLVSWKLQMFIFNKLFIQCSTLLFLQAKKSLLRRNCLFYKGYIEYFSDFHFI